jgi:hypothetical protein
MNFVILGVRAIWAYMHVRKVTKYQTEYEGQTGASYAINMTQAQPA